MTVNYFSKNGFLHIMREVGGELGLAKTEMRQG